MTVGDATQAPVLPTPAATAPAQTGDAQARAVRRRVVLSLLEFAFGLWMVTSWWTLAILGRLESWEAAIGIAVGVLILVGGAFGVAKSVTGRTA